MAGTLVVDTIKTSTTGTPTIQNTSGTEVGQFCKAWVALSLAGGVSTVNKSFNVSSVSYVTTGQFNVNFANNLPDGNYAVVGSASWDSGDGNAVCSVGPKGSGTKSNSVCACSCSFSSTYLNSSRASVAFFG